MIYKHELFDNTVDSFVLIDPTKPQIAFFPNEETQMFQHKSDDNIPSQVITNIETPTKYIGAATFNVPVILDETYVDFKTFDTNNNLLDFYTNEVGLVNIGNRIQKIKIPADKFNQTLTDETEILNNGGSSLKKNYGTYYLLVEPKYVDVSVLNIDRYNQATSGSGNTNNKRTILELSKAALKNTIWNFESSLTQAGRLYGSIVEIWDSNLTTLKQTKVIGENRFYFDDTVINPKVVLYPDNVGYDSGAQDVSIGDILRIYPRETYFEKILIEISYKKDTENINTMLSYLLNDTVRNIQNGIFEIYDNNGLSIDDNGNFDGKIIQRYQIFAKDFSEVRKRLK